MITKTDTKDNDKFLKTIFFTFQGWCWCVAGSLQYQFTRRSADDDHIDDGDVPDVSDDHNIDGNDDHNGDDDVPDLTLRPKFSNFYLL